VEHRKLRNFINLFRGDEGAGTVMHQNDLCHMACRMPLLFKSLDAVGDGVLSLLAPLNDGFHLADAGCGSKLLKYCLVFQPCGNIDGLNGGSHLKCFQGMMDNRQAADLEQLLALSRLELHPFSDTACGYYGYCMHRRLSCCWGWLMNKHGISVGQKLVILLECGFIGLHKQPMFGKSADGHQQCSFRLLEIG